jgi:hypothetical protein
MKSARSRQSESRHIGSRRSEALACVNARSKGVAILTPAFAATRSASFGVRIRLLCVPKTSTHIDRNLTDIEEKRFNPHSVELGGRFSPTRF